MSSFGNECTTKPGGGGLAGGIGVVKFYEHVGMS